MFDNLQPSSNNYDHLNNATILLIVILGLGYLAVVIWSFIQDNRKNRNSYIREGAKISDDLLGREIIGRVLIRGTSGYEYEYEICGSELRSLYDLALTGRIFSVHHGELVSHLVALRNKLNAGSQKNKWQTIWDETRQVHDNLWKRVEIYTKHKDGMTAKEINELATAFAAEFDALADNISALHAQVARADFQARRSEVASLFHARPTDAALGLDSDMK